MHSSHDSSLESQIGKLTKQTFQNRKLEKYRIAKILLLNKCATLLNGINVKTKELSLAVRYGLYGCDAGRARICRRRPDNIVSLALSHKDGHEVGMPDVLAVPRADFIVFHVSQ